MKKLILIALLLYGYFALGWAQQYNSVYEPSGKYYDYIGNFTDKDWAIVKKNGKCGFIDKSGKEIIPLVYDEVGFSVGWWSHDPYATVRQNQKWGVINTNGDLIIPIKYDKISGYNIKENDSYILVCKNGKYGCVDIHDRITIPFEYDELGEFWGESDNRAYAKKNGLYGYIDKQNNVVIPFKYTATEGFDYKGKLAYVKYNGKYGYVDNNGNEVILPQYDLASGFSEGLAAVAKNKKVGFINESGSVVIPFLYEYSSYDESLSSGLCYSFEGGISVVRTNKKCGTINKKGEIVIPIIYDRCHSISSTGAVELVKDGDVHYFDRFGNEYESELESDKAYDQVMADHGYRKNQFNIGLKYYKAKDYSAAIEWFSKSAKQDYDYAEYYLGWMYQYGQGVTANTEEAKLWYSKAAAQGHAASQKQLDKLGSKATPQPKNTTTTNKKLAKISWLEGNLSAGQYTFKIGIKSESKIEKVDVYVNENLERGIVAIDNDGYDMVVNRTVDILEGQNNTIKIVVTNASGDAVEEKSVTYKDKKVTPSGQPKRIALVMGNANYKVATKLKNPVNDATDVATKLENLGFTVIRSMDQTYKGMDLAIRDFGNQAKGYDVALFYYAGHGMQYDGINYIIPIDADLYEQMDAKYHCVNMNEVLEKMDGAKCPMKIVILDACRNNPFRSWTIRGADAGLCNMNAPTGTFIAFSTSPGRTAMDGLGDNSPYTSAILQILDIPGLSLTDFFQEVLEKVAKDTKEQQNPWTSGSFRGKFFFNKK